MKQRKFILIMLGVLLMIGISCNLTNIVSQSEDEPEAAEALSDIEAQLTEMAIEDEQEPTETSAPTELPQPTNTPEPTTPPRPSNTHAPTITASPSNSGLITEKDYYTEFETSDGWYDFYISPEAHPEYDLEYTGAGVDVFVETPNTYVYMLQEDLWYDRGDDLYLETEIATVSGPYDNNLALVFRVTEDGWYEFAIRTNGYWDFYSYDANDESYEYLDGGGSWSINMKHKTNVIGLLAQEDKFTIFINGTETKDVYNDQYTEGSVGLAVSSLEVGEVMFEVRNFGAVNDLSLAGFD